MGTSSGYSSSPKSSSTNGDTSAQSNELDEGVNITSQYDSDERALSKIIKDNNENLSRTSQRFPNPPPQSNPCYEVGDTGPAGGTIVSTPYLNNNNSQYYFELSPHNAFTMNNAGASSWNWWGMSYSGGGTCNPLPQYCEFGFVVNPTPGTCSPPLPIANMYNLWNNPNFDHQEYHKFRFEFGRGHYNTYSGYNNILTYSTVNSPPTYRANSTNAFDECRNFVLNGYDEWFLPSVEEWEEVRLNIPSAMTSGPPGEWYWSSTAGAWASYLGATFSFSQGPSNWDGVIGGGNAWAPQGNAQGETWAFVCNDSETKLVYRHLTASVRPMRRFKCTTPSTYVTSCDYDIGDKGPGGGTIFAVPFSGANNTKYFYEITNKDLSTGGTPYSFLNMTPIKCDLTSEQGAEFGVNHQPLLYPDGTPLGFGTGESNTSLINSFPGGGSIIPANPTIDTHDIAARLCQGYSYQGHSDWFLPSLHELQWAWSTVGPQATMIPGGNVNFSQDSTNCERIYWTSSTESLQSDETAWVMDALTGLPTHSARCYPFSVRAIRRFECEEEGLTYDYRLCSAGSQAPGNTQMATSISNSAFGAAGNMIPNAIGLQYLQIWPHKFDVRLNKFFGAPNTNTYHPYTNQKWDISIYHQDESLIGTWRYLSIISYQCSFTSCAASIKLELIDDNGYGVVNLTQLNDSTYYTSSHDGNAYIRFDIPVGPIQQFGLPNGRGNTLNLEDYLGTGISHRTTNQNPYPSPGTYPWKWWCSECGTDPYQNLYCQQWMAELPPPTTGTIYLPSPILHNSYSDCQDNQPCCVNYGGCGGSSSSKLASPEILQECDEYNQDKDTSLNKYKRQNKNKFR